MSKTKPLKLNGSAVLRCDPALIPGGRPTSNSPPAITGLPSASTCSPSAVTKTASMTCFSLVRFQGTAMTTPNPICIGWFGAKLCVQPPPSTYSLPSATCTASQRIVVTSIYMPMLTREGVWIVGGECHRVAEHGTLETLRQSETQSPRNSSQ